MGREHRAHREANKRYATTESRLTNLKNTAVLSPSKSGMTSTRRYRNSSTARMTCWRLPRNGRGTAPADREDGGLCRLPPGRCCWCWARPPRAWARCPPASASLPPPWAKRGGGWKGLLSTLSRSPTVWLAIAAATVTATVAFADYISGAKQAREALEAMQQTAEDWKNTAAETFYGSSEGLSFFGMSDSDFSRQTQSAPGLAGWAGSKCGRTRKGNGRDRGLVDGILQGPHCQHTRGAIQPQGHGG